MSREIIPPLVYSVLFLTSQPLPALQQQTTTIIINNKPSSGSVGARKGKKQPARPPAAPSSVTYNKTIHIDQGGLSQDLPRIINKKAEAWTAADYIALGAVGATIFGAIVAVFQGIIFPFRVKRLEMKLQYVLAQLKDFYGPLLVECIRADSAFRRVELSLSALTPGGSIQQQHHSSLRKLRLRHFTEPIRDTNSPDEDDRLRFYAQILTQSHLENDRRQIDLIKRNVHLFGPYPPLSFFLFLTHAAQFEALITIKQRLDLVTPIETFDSKFKDPYVISPFPMAFTAEVSGKVAWLKAMQQEYEYRISKVGFRLPFSRRSPHMWHRSNYKSQVYKRGQYFLIMDNIRVELNERLHEHLHYVPSSPLIWGPYTAIELIEIRAWLIFKELPLRDTHNLEDEHRFILALLAAKVAKAAKKDTPLAQAFEQHFRAGQAFDEIGPVSKTVSKWDSKFVWEHMVDNPRDFRSMWFLMCSFALSDLPESDGFAYDRGLFEQLHRDQALSE
jgi:hypothetical protein